MLDLIFNCGDQLLLFLGFQNPAQRAVLQRGPHQREAHNCGDEYVVECGEVRRDGVVRTVVMYKSCVVKHYHARHTAWLLDRTDRTAS